MSFSYSRYDSQNRRSNVSNQRQRTAFSYWIPLGITVATAAIGFAVWAWNERKWDEDSSSDDDHHDDPYARPRPPPSRPSGGGGGRSSQRRDRRQETTTTTSSSGRAAGGGEQQTEVLEIKDNQTTAATAESQDSTTLYSRMSGAIKRTPSPQQLFDGASKRVAAGVAAAGAVVGRGLSTLKESDEDFQDHERWSAEAENRNRNAGAMPMAAQQPQKRKRMVAVVVDASPKEGSGDIDPEYEIEHASLLSHLPLHIDSSAVDLLVLIYAPQLTTYPLVHATATAPSLSNGGVGPTSPLLARNPSAGSSFSNISAAAAMTPGDEEGEFLHHHDENDKIPPPAPEAPTPTSPEATARNLLPPAYAHLQQRALRLVPHPTHIIPFTTPTGHIHLLRHLAPSLVYIQESLCGSVSEGENVKQIEGWVGQIVVVVGGEGLAVDTETETEDESGAHSSKKLAESRKPTTTEWWKDDHRVGLGRTQVVEGWRFEDDWIKRVGA